MRVKTRRANCSAGDNLPTCNMFFSCTTNETLKCFNCNYISTDFANISFHSASQAYLLGERVVLKCPVKGDPPPYVAWINVTDGSVLQNRTVNTSYVIPGVSFHHKGTYRCETGNRCGNDSKEMNITDVFGKYC